MFLKKDTSWRFGILTVILLAVFLVVNLFGEVLGQAANSYCSSYFGCTNEFFGYDAIEHFLFGLTLSSGVIWFCKKFPHHSILQEERWKKWLFLISFIALISVFWEFLECAYDLIRVDVLGQHLFSFSLHINLLSQPSNLDTMGDIAFTLLGGIIPLFF